MLTALKIRIAATKTILREIPEKDCSKVAGFAMLDVEDMLTDMETLINSGLIKKEARP